MSNSLGYRSAKPDLSSSSPLANLHDLSSSEPLSPGSPTPAFRRSLGSGSTTATLTSLESSSSQSNRLNPFLHSPNNSHPDPFSANAKASPNSHPSFGKDQLRAKHLRNSPNASSLISSVGGHSHLWNKEDEILRQHFHDSSDDHPSSDDVGPHNFGIKGPLNTSANVSLVPPWSGTGLGIHDESTNWNTQKSELLGSAFQEPTSPTLGKKPRARTFERTQSSSHDPFSAIGGSSIRPPQDASDRIKTNEGSPRSQIIRQRRRLTGSSPKQLTRVAGKASNRLWNENESDSDEQIRSWERTISGSYFQQKDQKSTVDISARVANMIEKEEHVLNLSESNLTSIHPSIADLSKYVRIPNFRREDESVRSVSGGGMSRTSSLANAQERLGGSPIHSPSRSRNGGSGNTNKLEVYLVHNALRSLSSALFLVTNLTVLSIRGNKLTELPPAIGQLINLTELNVAANEFRYFPSEIQQLNLTKFAYFPNPYLLKPSKDARLSVRKPFGQQIDARVEKEEKMEEEPSSATSAIPGIPTPAPGSMGPPALPIRNRSFARMPSQPSFASGFQHVETALGRAEDKNYLIASTLETKETIVSELPSLGELCIRTLLQADHGQSVHGRTNQSITSGTTQSTAIMLDRYEAGSISGLRGTIDGDHIKILESARRSASGSWAQFRISSNSWYSAGELEVKETSTSHVPQLEKSQISPSKSKRIDSDDFMIVEDEDGGEASGEWSSSDDERRAKIPVVDVIEELDQGDDSMKNPWFNRCPNPHHLLDASKKNANDWPNNDSNRIFNQHSVQRIEWVSHIGGYKVMKNLAYNEALSAHHSTPTKSKEDDESTKTDKRPLAQDSDCLPILWRGCMRGCLGFLDEQTH